MEINGINPLGRLNEAQRKAEAEERRQSGGAEKLHTGDSVEVSGSIAGSHATALAQLPEVRTERIEELQSAIASGTYNVPSDKIAEMMIDELL